MLKQIVCQNEQMKEPPVSVLTAVLQRYVVRYGFIYSQLAIPLSLARLNTHPQLQNLFLLD